jgi:hypothetical protein
MEISFPLFIGGLYAFVTVVSYALLRSDENLLPRSRAIFVSIFWLPIALALILGLLIGELLKPINEFVDFVRRVKW